MTTRRNNKSAAANKVIVETVDADTQVDTQVDADTQVDTDANAAAVVDTDTDANAAAVDTDANTDTDTAVVDTDTSAMVSVAIAPCGYVVKRVNLGNFAVAYRTTRNDRAMVGMVAAVYNTLDKADKAAARVNAGVAINPQDTASLVAGSAIVLPAYQVHTSQLPQVRAQLTWLYAAWLQAETAWRNGQLLDTVAS